MRNYMKEAFKLNFSNKVLILMLILIPLVLGTLYGLLYSGMMSGMKANLDTLLDQAIKAQQDSAAGSGSGLEIITLKALPTLEPIATMQLNVFCGLTFFITSFSLLRFIKGRERHIVKRLIASGYSSGQVFWSEALAMALTNLIIIATFNLLFIAFGYVTGTIPAVFFSALENLGTAQGQQVVSGLILMVIAQSTLATAYTLLGLGIYRTERTFSMFHMLPAFLMAFLGGAVFPVDAVASSGLYMYMPNYILSQTYTGLYTAQWAMNSQDLYFILVLFAISVALSLIGRWRFTLQEA